MLSIENKRDEQTCLDAMRILSEATFVGYFELNISYAYYG